MTWISNLQLNSRKHQPVKRQNQLTPEALTKNPEASTSHVSRWATACHPSVPSKSVGNLRAMCWLKWKFATPVRWTSCWRCPLRVFFFVGKRFLVGDLPFGARCCSTKAKLDKQLHRSISYILYTVYLLHLCENITPMFQLALTCKLT